MRLYVFLTFNRSVIKYRKKNLVLFHKIPKVDRPVEVVKPAKKLSEDLSNLNEENPLNLT